MTALPVPLRSISEEQRKLRSDLHYLQDLVPQRRTTTERKMVIVPRRWTGKNLLLAPLGGNFYIDSDGEIYRVSYFTSANGGVFRLASKARRSRLSTPQLRYLLEKMIDYVGIMP